VHGQGARRAWLLGFRLVLHRERAVAGVEEVTGEVEVGAADPPPGPAGGAAVMHTGVQRMPPDAAADGEAGEARNWGRDLQPVVELVLTCGPAEDDTAGGSPAAPGGRGDRDRVVVVVEALHPPHRRYHPAVLQVLDDLHGCVLASA
jgi:hypothetical protein